MCFLSVLQISLYSCVSMALLYLEMADFVVVKDAIG